MLKSPTTTFVKGFYSKTLSKCLRKLNKDTVGFLFPEHLHRRAISLSHTDKDEASVDLDGVIENNR